MLPDPAQEARARDVSQELRCLVCRNQSIDDSDADLAHDLRVLVRERITAGDSNDQVSPMSARATAISCCCARRSSSAPLLLWGGPLLILLLGGFAVRALLPRPRATRRRPPPLTAEEQQRLDGRSRRGKQA